MQTDFQTALMTSPGRTSRRGRGVRAYALLMVMVLTGLSLIAMSSVMQWSLNNSGLLQRGNEFQSGITVAEGALDLALGQMAADFQAAGESAVYSRLNDYRRLVPSAADDREWGHYSVAGGGSPGSLAIDRIGAPQFQLLQSKYSGLRGTIATYRATAEVRDDRSVGNLTTALRQELQLASIPLFGFGIFYAMDLEVCPSQPMGLTGRVHSNGRIYAYPNRDTVDFYGHVTASHDVLMAPHPEDPTVRTQGRVNYRAERDSGVTSLWPPFGQPPTPALMRSMIDIPPVGESRTSALGLQRYFNKADLILLISNNTVVASSGAYNGFAVSIPWGTEINRFVDTNQFFFDKRESREVQATEIDLATFGSRYTQLRALLGRDPVTVYVADLRSVAGHRMSGIRLKNGATLPAPGLVVASPNPLYVQGHFNSFSSHRGSTNTSRCVPAALIADALSIQSEGWRDDRSYDGLDRRSARNTTFNAAVITGIVPTRSGVYSGGFENTLRLLEDWSGETLTFNGSLIVLFESLVATAPWGAPDVYSAPTRRFGWDSNFATAARLPAGTPELRTVVRSQWTITRAQGGGGG